MPLEKEGKFMETFKARIIRGDQNTILELAVEGNALNIILTDDNPNNVKTIFNKLLIQLKNGIFNFELEDDKEDLYFQISKEYLFQLNSELASIYLELEDYDLIIKQNN